MAFASRPLSPNIGSIISGPINPYFGYSQGLSLRIITMTNLPRHHFFDRSHRLATEKKDGDVVKGCKAGRVYVLSIGVFIAL
jgi:hypothetical protein